MSNIIIPGRLKNTRDCKDWVGLDDGTVTKDTVYCNLSTKCRQLGMKSDWYFMKDPVSGQEVCEYLCTGYFVTNDNKSTDEEAS